MVSYIQREIDYYNYLYYLIKFAYKTFNLVKSSSNPVSSMDDLKNECFVTINAVYKISYLKCNEYLS